MLESADEQSETIESRIRQLISERNRLAHGGQPDNLLSAALMCSWLDEAGRFVERVARVLQCHIADLLDLNLDPIGMVDPVVSLGRTTVAIAELRANVSIGDHLFLRGVKGGTKSCVVVSLQRQDEELTSAPTGLTAVAVTVDKRINSGHLCLPI